MGQQRLKIGHDNNQTHTHARTRTDTPTVVEAPGIGGNRAKRHVNHGRKVNGAGKVGGVRVEIGEAIPQKGKRCSNPLAKHGIYTGGGLGECK